MTNTTDTTGTATGIASYARSFADCCPACTEGPWTPYAAAHRGEELTAGYRCGRCGHKWICSWMVSPEMTEEPT